MIVVDASALAEVALRTTTARRVQDVLLDHGELHAPALLDFELASIFRSAHLRDDVGWDDLALSLSIVAALPIVRHDAEPLMTRMLELAHSVSAYDAAYIALAEALDAPLLTLDRHLGRAHGHEATVLVVD